MREVVTMWRHTKMPVAPGLTKGHGPMGRGGGGQAHA